MSLLSRNTYPLINRNQAKPGCVVHLRDGRALLLTYAYHVILQNKLLHCTLLLILKRTMMNVFFIIIIILIFTL